MKRISSKVTAQKHICFINAQKLACLLLEFFKYKSCRGTRVSLLSNVFACISQSLARQEFSQRLIFFDQKTSLDILLDMFCCQILVILYKKAISSKFFFSKRPNWCVILKVHWTWMILTSTVRMKNCREVQILRSLLLMNDVFNHPNTIPFSLVSGANV